MRGSSCPSRMAKPSGRNTFRERELVKLAKKKQELAKLEAIDYRAEERGGQGPELVKFWERWRGYYGDSGLVNPRGDRLLTELSIRAIQELRPKLLMVNYQDCDYVQQ